MLSYLAPPIAGETLHSLLARSREMLGCRRHLGYVRAAFGPGERAVRTTLTGSLAAFAEASGCDPELAVARWTSFAYFAPFMSPAAASKLEADLMSGHPRGGYAGIGHMRGDAHWHRRLNFCPDCRDADVARFGTAAWRTAHQLPGVFVCLEHSAPLRASDVAAVGSRALHPCPRDGPGMEVRSPFAPGTALRIARASGWLLLNPHVACAATDRKSVV